MKCPSGYSVLRKFFVSETKHGTLTVQRRGLMWLMVSVGSVHGLLAPRQKNYGKRRWWSKFFHPMVAKRWIERKKE